MAGSQVIERPILFSGAMVRAIREDRKTQTRRVMKPQPFLDRGEKGNWWLLDRSEDGYGATNSAWREGEEPFWTYCPYGKPGDRLWVRESALYKSECGGYYCRETDCWGNFEAWTADGKTHWLNDARIKTWEDAAKPTRPLEYCVGGFSAEQTGQKKDSFTLTLLRCDTGKIVKPYQGNTIIEKREITFRRRVPGIHMPRWASRLTLEIVSVKVERVQEISEADAIAEGIYAFADKAKGCFGVMGMDCRTMSGLSAKDCYRKLWDSINAKRTIKTPDGEMDIPFARWDKNPWVWCLTFKKVSGPSAG